MSIDKYFQKFILWFFCGKLFLITLILFLGLWELYSDDQVRDIIYIISPTFVISLVIFLKYLKSRRKKEENPDTTTITKTEAIIVATGLIFYLSFITFYLLTQQAGTEAFIGLKLRIAFVETLMSGLFGWVIIEINNQTK